jgi:acyl-CoA synthetase (NDP forming)
MITGGIETIVGVVQEPVFGPVVVFGLGGIATEVLADHAARLAPLTGADADDLIRAIGAARTLLEHEVDIPALRDVLLRVSRLADDLPQVAELDLNPLMARPGRRRRSGRAHPRDQPPPHPTRSCASFPSDPRRGR